MMKFSVPDMSCGHCTAAISKTINAVDPAARVITDLDHHTVEINTSKSAESIAQAIKDAGYESTPL